MEEENVKSIAEYIEVVNRRKWLIFTTFIIIGFLSVVLAMKLPPVYRSYATILIEDQQIPRTMVQTTITDFADKRIELIKQRVMTRDKILSIIQKHKLYLDERKKMVPSELVGLFQESAEITTISANVRDPLRGGGKATIAFSIAFNDESPVLAQNVANELVTLFLNENTRNRAQRAAKTTDFLKDEADKLKKEITDVETRIMDYKGKYGKSLPEMLPTNLASLDRLRNSLRQTENEIRTVKDRIIFLTDSLRQAEEEGPVVQTNKALSKEEQLRLLKSEYINLTSRYTASHPSIQRVKRQIQNLDPGFSGELSGSNVRRQLTQAEDDLTVLKEKYASDHPDVIRLEQQVEKLSQRITAPSKKNQNQAGAPYESAHVLSLVSQLRSSENELSHLLKVKQDYQNTLNETQSDYDRTPLVEKEYQELVRMRLTSMNKYAEMEAKFRQARLAQTLEEEQKGEAFTIIEPPIAPDKPDKPNRKKIVLLGLGLGLGLGLALSVILEMMNDVVRGQKSLERITGMQPIVVIPYIETPQDILKRKQNNKIILIICIALIVVAIALVHFLVMPLEQIGEMIMLKIGRL